jgi:hypothetical protein
MFRIAPEWTSISLEEDPVDFVALIFLDFMARCAVFYFFMKWL